MSMVSLFLIKPLAESSLTQASSVMGRHVHTQEHRGRPAFLTRLLLQGLWCRWPRNRALKIGVRESSLKFKLATSGKAPEYLIQGRRDLYFQRARRTAFYYVKKYYISVFQKLCLEDAASHHLNKSKPKELPDVRDVNSCDVGTGAQTHCSCPRPCFLPTDSPAQTCQNQKPVSTDR